MEPELRETGISALGYVPWGTHFCTFYETKEDLLDILLPFFKTGLEHNEFCLWMVSHPVGVEDARRAFKEAVADADRHLAAGHIEIVQHPFFPRSHHGSRSTHAEIVHHAEGYLKGGAAVAERVTDGWNEKLAEALANGFDGMRANSHEAWLTEANRNDFFRYEEKLGAKLAGQRLIVLCSYPSVSTAAEIFDVTHAHHFAVIRREGYDVVLTTELNQAEAEIKRPDEESEQRVVERARELAAHNEQLKKEIAERWRAEDRIRLITDTIPVMAWSVRPDGIVDFLNQRWMDYSGLSLAQYVSDPAGPIHPQDTPRVLEKWRAQMALGEAYDDEMRLRRADGEYRHFLVRTAPLRDEAGRVVKWYGVSTDIEDRKRVEEELEESLSHLRGLTASLMRAQDDERRRIAQMLHETTAQDLAALRMLLGRLSRTGTTVSDADRMLLAESVDLTDRSMADVRTLSYLLHPPLLDENGLLSAVRWYAKGFADRSGIAVDVEEPPTFERLPQDVETTLFRVVQEALTNIHRHARSTTARISLRAERDGLTLEIADRGCGMSADVLWSVTNSGGAPGVGILGMRERLQQLGGTLCIESNDRGTTLRAMVPFTAQSS